MTEVTVKDIINRIEDFAPPYLAEEWDPIGLSFGSMDKPVKKLLLALDIDADTIQEAKELDIDLIFTHHPAIFDSLKTLNTEDTRRKEYNDLIKSDIAVFSAHTNIDAADYGMSDWLADVLMFPKNRQIVSTVYQEAYKKVAVYVPVSSTDHLRKALHKAGAGEVGDYKDVSYTLEGHGRFTPQDGADPAIGKIEEEEIVAENRVEMMFPNRLTSRIIETIHREHPYEEPVFDLYTLENEKKDYGYGRIADVDISTAEMVERVKSSFGLDGLRFASKDSQKKHTKAAVFGGSGEKYYKEVKAQGVTLFITGDISYHGAQDMLRDGIDVIDPGHYIESVFAAKMQDVIEGWKKEEDWEMEIYSSKQQKDVFKFS